MQHRNPDLHPTNPTNRTHQTNRMNNTATSPVEALAEILRTARHLGLSLAALQTLLALAEHGETNMTALAAEIGVSTAQMTETSKRLIRSCLVRRAHNCSSDMRIVNLQLTESGRRILWQLTGDPSLI